MRADVGTLLLAFTLVGGLVAATSPSAAQAQIVEDDIVGPSSRFGFNSSSGSSTGSRSGSSHPSPGGAQQKEAARETPVPDDAGPAQEPATTGPKASVTFSECVQTTFSGRECRAEYGNMSTDPLIVDESLHFTFPRDTQVPIMLWADRDYISTDVSDSMCYFEVSGRQHQVQELSGRNVTTFYITSDETVSISSSGGGCYISILYAGVTPVSTTVPVPADQVSGSIVYPTADDILDVWGYAPQRRLAYTFEYPENYIIDLSVTHLDLGYSSSDLHLTINYDNYTVNDFLLVGAGTEILASTDLLFFGHLDDAVNIRINSPSCHVVVYVRYHEQYASGVTVDFNAYKGSSVVMTTSSTTTTPFSPTLPSPPSTWASINGVLDAYTSEAAVEAAFTSAVAEMASTFINTTGLQVEAPPSVSPSDVWVYSMASCRVQTCEETCAAFNFSIRKLTPSKDAWAFSEEDLNAMLREEELQHVWSENLGAGCTFCEEETNHSWWVLGGVAIGVVVVALLLAVVVWSVASYSTRRKSKETQEEDQKREALERRRRSSGDVSIIGGVKGETTASLPFGGGEMGLDMGDDEQELSDTVGFTEYDPDTGFEDIGIGPEVLNDPRALRFYSNEAFEADEPDLPPFVLGGTSRKNVVFVDPSSSPTSPLRSNQSPTASPRSAFKRSLKRRQPRDVRGGKLSAVEETENDGADNVSELQFLPTDRTIQFKVPADVHRGAGVETGL